MVSLYFSCCWIHAEESVCTGSEGCWESCCLPGMALSLHPLQPLMSSPLPPQKPRAAPVRPASTKTKLCFSTYCVPVHGSGHWLSGNCGLSGLCLWWGTWDSSFLVLELLFARCVALEDLALQHSSFSFCWMGKWHLPSHSWDKQ